MLLVTDVTATTFDMFDVKCLGGAAVLVANIVEITSVVYGFEYVFYDWLASNGLLLFFSAFQMKQCIMFFRTLFLQAPELQKLDVCSPLKQFTHRFCCWIPRKPSASNMLRNLPQWYNLWPLLLHSLQALLFSLFATTVDTVLCEDFSLGVIDSMVWNCSSRKEKKSATVGNSLGFDSDCKYLFFHRSFPRLS